MDSRIKSRVGETRIANNGQKMTIINYVNNENIDIQFEDGTIVTKKKYCHFIIGNIENPNYKAKRMKGEQKYIGLTNVAKFGMKMTIIAYRNVHDIDVQFEDGYIAYKKSLSSFKRSSIANHNLDYNKKYIGMEKIARNGQKMKIIAYRGISDIDVMFEDGTIVEHKTLKVFESGGIENPNAMTHQIYEGVGAVCIAKNGLKMEVIAYRSCEDIDIKYEDEIIVEHKAFYNFLNGGIGHPKLKSKSGSVWSDDYFGYRVKKAFNVEDKIYYEAYKNDEFVALMTLQEIYKSFQK